MPSKQSRRSKILYRGEKGSYRTAKKLGSGGNGIVYEAIVENNDHGILPNLCALKVFSPSNNLEKEERIERFERFKLEIEYLKQLDNRITGLLPILDFHISMSPFDKKTWYLMPKAEKFSFKDDVEDRLDEMISLGEIIQQLHTRGYDHRDIKPGNLLYYEGHIVLSDLGLCWYESSEYNITGSSEILGPSSIRPPEFERHRNAKEIDYKKSDVYLFAKTVWIVLNQNWNGFRGEYNRRDPQIYLDKKSVKAKTLEPIHKMMEEATKDDFSQRIDIDDCLHYLRIQKEILDGSFDNATLNRFLREEAIGHASALDPDIRHYNSPVLVSHVLKRLSAFSFSVFVREFSKNRIIGNLTSIEELNDSNDYMFRLFDERMQEYKSIFLHVSSLKLSANDSSIETSRCELVLDDSKECVSVKDILERGYSSYVLRGDYIIMFGSESEY